MSHIQTSTSKHINTNVSRDSLNNLNKYNDVFLNSNCSSGYQIPSTLKTFTNERINKNAYLNGLIHSSDAISSLNENRLKYSGEHFYCYHHSNDKNNSMELIHGSEKKNLDNESAKSNLVYLSNGCNFEDYSNGTGVDFINNDSNNIHIYEKNMKNCSEYSNSVKSINGKFEKFNGNSSPFVKEYPHQIEPYFTSIYNRHLNTKCNLSSRSQSYNDKNSCDINYCLSDTDKESTTNNYQFNDFKAISEKFNKENSSTNIINREILNDICLDEYTNYKESYLNDKLKLEKTLSNYLEFKYKNGSLKREVECNDISERNHTVPLENIFPNKHSCLKEKEARTLLKSYSDKKEDQNNHILPYNKKTKSYSLEDMKNGKVEIPSTIFMKLPCNSSDVNIIDSYVKNKKLLNFMKDCNDSVSYILKYPQIEKNKNKTIKISPNDAPAISENIGSHIIYEDNFDRRNYHPNVQNLHMGKIFEKHVFSILKNKKDLGKKIFEENDKFKKYEYDNNEGFWVSNIDKKRLVNPEKNDSYVTELVYEKNNSYDKEMKMLKSCDNYEDIPTINDLHKDNNFYAFLIKEKLYSSNLKPVIATIMRRYDVDKVSDYKQLETNESITPVCNA